MAQNLQGKRVAILVENGFEQVEANVVRGRTVTSWPSLQTDLRNAGAHWVDQQVVVDAGLVTSRKPDDIPAFNEAMLKEFGEAAGSGPKQAGAKAAKSGKAEYPEPSDAPMEGLGPDPQDWQDLGPFD